MGCHPNESYIHYNADDDYDLTPEQEQAIENAGCCLGAAEYGPQRCTCWVPIYSHAEQGKPWQATPGQRETMCEDCAYRPDSPERNGDPNQRGSEPGELDRIAETSIFWCHQGIRRLIAYEHPTLGFRVEPRGTSYDPPIINAIPYRADGTPAEKCAGWAARRAQIEASF